MGRYKVRKEITKHGRKVEVQYAVVDTLDDRVVVRYATEKDAADLISKFEASVTTSSPEE